MLERLITKWEYAIERLWLQLDFYVWIVDAFVLVDDLDEIVPPPDLPMYRRRDLPWFEYERAA